MRRWRTTLIVLGVFAALLLYVVLFEARREPPAEPGARPSPTPASVLDLAADDVRALHIAAGDRSLSLLRQEGAWAIAVPDGAASEAVPAEPSIYWSVDEILRLQARRIVAEQATDLAQYGLDEPRQTVGTPRSSVARAGPAMTVAVETASGASELLRVGRETPDGTAYYLQRDGDPRLYIVDHYKVQTLYDWLADPPYAPTAVP
jgi:hypothetical protein